MISIWKLIYELEYWIMIGTGDDIVRCPDNRPEYRHLVDRLKADKVPDHKIPAEVLVSLKNEAKLPMLKRPTFWHLVKLSLKRSLLFWR